MTEIRCPMCAHMNPEELLCCEKCGARLIPMGDLGKDMTVPPVSQPEDDDLSALLEQIVDESEQDTTINDGLDQEVLFWLDDEHLDQTDDGLDETLTSDEEAGEASDFLSMVEEEIDEKVITNWLSKISEEEGVTEESADWVALVVNEPDEDLSEVERWLEQSEQASDEDQEDEEESTKEKVHSAPLPDWMLEQSDETSFEDIPADEILDEDKETIGGEEPQLATGLPDWMREVEETVEVKAPEVLPEEELPDWFTQELGEEALEQTEPPEGDRKQPEEGSKPLPVPKVATDALPWMGGLSLGEEGVEEEDSSEDFDLPAAATQIPDKVEKLPRVQTGALPWLNAATSEDEWVDSDESEAGLDEIFTQASAAKEPDSEEDFLDDEIGLSLEEFFLQNVPLAEDTHISGEEEVEQVSFEDVVAENSFLVEENLSTAAEEELSMEGTFETEADEDDAKSWSKFLETADKLGEAELPEWFAKTGAHPAEPVESRKDEPTVEESGGIQPEPLEIDEPPKPEPSVKKRGTTWQLLFGRRKQKPERQDLEVTEPTPEPVPEPEPEIGEPEPSVPQEGAANALLQEGEWDLSTILSDSHPLTSEPDDESIAEEIKGELTNSAWLTDESGRPLIDETDEAQTESDAAETEHDSKPVLALPQEEEPQPADEPADGMSSLDRLTASIGLGEKEKVEELVDDDMIGFAGEQESPTWMVGDDEQEVEAAEILDAALDETNKQSEPMTAELPDWLEEAAEDTDRSEEALSPEPEGERVVEEIIDVDEAEEVVSTAELPAWLAEEEAHQENEPTTSVAGESEESTTTDWLAEFAVDDEPAETEAETEGSETEEETAAVLPDWLLESDKSDETPDEIIEELFSAAPAMTGSDSGLLDWLSTYADIEEEAEAEEGEEEKTTETATAADITPIDIIQEPDELDDWLIKSEEDDAESLAIDDTGALNEWVQEHNIQFPTMDEDEGLVSIDDDIIPVDIKKDLPDWVFELEPDDEGEPIPEMSGAGTAELPAWLMAGDESPDEEKIDSGAPAEEVEFFDFLAPDDTIAATAIFGASDGFGESFGEEDDDLRSLIIDDGTYTSSAGFDSQSEWLGSYAEGEPPADASSNEEEVQESEEIPGWVQLADTSGGWETGIESFGAALKFDTFEEETVREIPNEERNIQLMERILLSEKKAVPVPQTHQRNRQLTLRLTMTLLMIVLVAVGLLYLPIQRPNFIANAPIQVVQFHQQMQYYQQTAPDKPVLVVFDLQPAYEGELSVYAELPLKALMENDTRIFTFSTVPEGAALAQKMMVDVVMANNLVYNTQSQALNLGYLPGGAAAIRDFALNMRLTVHGLDVGVNGVYIWEHPGTSDIDSLDDFAMVIVMTDDLDKARVWIEQSSLYLPPSTPLLMVSSAKIAPLLKPYLLSGQLGGLIGNPIDAAAYATLSNANSKVIYFWKAYEFGIYLMMASVISGAVYLIVSQLRKEKNSNKRGGRP